ncbi:hypothetical protein [Actinomadura litoris]|uniref:Uncharacterized protein n=1 Tax=Actinomadura litoris TaxID=2678616 RepID=A0A7K1LAC9_9ACTN|nr:hypothetical protein [Actinomadura litoris]MUN41378.1 hypothetical protein [Actinomadura litoris]
MPEQQKHEDRPDATDPQYAALAALTASLQGRGYEPVHDKDTAVLNVVDPVDHPADTITCQPRAVDGGLLWFFNGAGTPIAPASHIVEATVLIVADRDKRTEQQGESADALHVTRP